MYFKDETLQEITKLTSDSRFARLFEDIKSNPDYNGMPTDVMRELADIFVAELGLDRKDTDKIFFIISLGYRLHEPNCPN